MGPRKDDENASYGEMNWNTSDNLHSGKKPCGGGNITLGN
jgi:hypothetical protein